MRASFNLKRGAENSTVDTGTIFKIPGHSPLEERFQHDRVEGLGWQRNESFGHRIDACDRHRDEEESGTSIKTTGSAAGILKWHQQRRFLHTPPHIIEWQSIDSTSRRMIGGPNGCRRLHGERKSGFGPMIDIGPSSSQCNLHDINGWRSMRPVLH
jgi:hypothetical protein